MIRYSSKGWAWLLICLQLSTHSLAALQHIENAHASLDASNALTRFDIDLLANEDERASAIAENDNIVVSNEGHSVVAAAAVGVDNETAPTQANNKRTIEKRSIDDLIHMDHPEYMGEHWMDTFRNHVDEIHRRGHRLTLRQEPVDESAVTAAFRGSNAKFDVDSEAARLSTLPAPQNVSYAQVPVDAKEIFTGVIVGIGGVLVPGLREANNGSEALATFQKCFDPRKLHETFVIGDFFQVQSEMPSISDADLDEFAASTMADGGSASELLGRFENLRANAWRTWKYLAAILKKLGPYMLALLKHAQTCGVLDIVLGFAISFVIPFFPPMLLLLVAVAAMAFELFTQIKAAVDNWYKDWFKFGKAVGAIVAFIISLVVSYLMNRGRQVQCTQGKGKGCTYEMPENEMEKWQPPDAKKHCGGQLCNPVYRRDDVIDPYLLDSMGRTNIERMKAGSAAIGPDGKPMNLHHIYQTPDGPIAELTDTFHSVNHGELHTFLKPGEPSRIDRDAFGVWRSSYWRERGRFMETALATGEYVWVAAQKAADYGPLAITSVVKSWDSITDGVPKVGDFLGRVIDAITDGQPDGRVTSVKEGLGTLDIFRLLLKALKSTAMTAADETDAAMAPVDGAMRPLTPNAAPGMAPPLARCSLDATCSDALPLEAHAFQRADAAVANGVTKKYVAHFAPDTGFALALSAIVNEGAAELDVQRSASDGTLTRLAAHERRGAAKLAHKADYLAEFPAARHRVTLQHCDGYGDYTLLATGARPPPPASEFDSEDPKWKAFWQQHGGPPDADQSFLSVGAQYVPYPSLRTGATAGLADDGLALRFPAAPLDTARYLVYVTPADAPALGTSCDVLRQGVLAVDAPAASSDEGSDVTISVPAEHAGARAYVLAESEAGALTLYPNNGADEAPDASGIELPAAGLSGGALAGIAVSLTLVVCLMGLLLVCYLKKAGKINTRLPTYNRHAKKFQLQ